MNKPERDLIRKYAKQTGGTLIFEYPMVKKAADRGSRRLDALIIRGGLPKEADWRRVGDLTRKEVEFIQAKNSRLGMSLMGQALFSRSLMNEVMQNKGWKLKARRWLALCTRGDKRLGALMADYGIDVVVPGSNGFVVDN